MNDNQQFLLYTAPDGAVRVEVYFKDETVWLTQKALAELFGVKRPAVTKHLSNIFASGELAENSVCSILEHTAGDGKTYKAQYYNLDAHVKELNRIVSAYLDLAENRAERGIVTRMSEWAEFLNRFLELSNYPILQDKGKVSALEAKLKAEGEYEVFRQRQDREYISDFDREIKRLEGKDQPPRRQERQGGDGR